MDPGRGLWGKIPDLPRFKNIIFQHAHWRTLNLKLIATLLLFSQKAVLRSNSLLYSHWFSRFWKILMFLASVLTTFASFGNKLLSRYQLCMAWIISSETRVISELIANPSRGPFLESPGNLPGPISDFGEKCFLINRSQFLLALNTKFENLIILWKHWSSTMSEITVISKKKKKHLKIYLSSPVI